MDDVIRCMCGVAYDVVQFILSGCWTRLVVEHPFCDANTTGEDSHAGKVCETWQREINNLN